MDFQEVNDLLEHADCDVQRWRSDGQTDVSYCLAVVTMTPVLELFADVLRSLANLDHDSLVLIEKLMRGARTATLGRGTVIYWPEITWVDLDEDEPCDPDDSTADAEVLALNGMGDQ